MRDHLKPFLMFGLIGVVGFAVDAGALYLVMGLGIGIGPYLGRVISYLCAATATWILNRSLTFRDRAGEGDRGSLLRQWLAFLAANAVGGAVNYALYSMVVAFGPAGEGTPLLGVALGSLGGWVFNYTLSHKFVFRA